MEDDAWLALKGPEPQKECKYGVFGRAERVRNDQQRKLRGSMSELKGKQSMLH